MLAEKGTELGGPWSDHLDGPVWELRIWLRDVAARIMYWCTAEATIVLLTVFGKTRQHDQKQIDRASRAQKVCERDRRRAAWSARPSPARGGYHHTPRRTTRSRAFNIADLARVLSYQRG